MKNKRGITKSLASIFIALIIILIGNPIHSIAASKSSLTKTQTYTITEKSKPSANIQKLDTYNKYTEDWYLFNETFEKCEKAGGGKVVVKKGTYNICRPVYIPSNVTFLLEDGVAIKKLTKTGTTILDATKSLFVLVEPSKAKVSGAHSLYDGVHNVRIIGEGNAVIDLDFMVGSIGFAMAHNKDISYEGVTFKNMNTGHFIELDASLDITINNCIFSGSKQSPKINKEAINIDTPDKITGGFSQTWTSYDKTPVKNLTVTNCTFEEIDVAIGTHKYSQNKDENGKYTINMTHENIVIKNNKFLNIRKTAFAVINWDNITVEDNLFDGGGYTIKLSSTGEEVFCGSRAFIATAVTKFIFRNNTLNNLNTVGGAYSASTGIGSASGVYTPIKTYITYEEMEHFKNNTFSNIEFQEVYFNSHTSEFYYDPEVIAERAVIGRDMRMPSILSFKTGVLAFYN